VLLPDLCSFERTVDMVMYFYSIDDDFPRALDNHKRIRLSWETMRLVFDTLALSTANRSF